MIKTLEKTSKNEPVNSLRFSWFEILRKDVTEIFYKKINKPNQILEMNVHFTTIESMAV